MRPTADPAPRRPRRRLASLALALAGAALALALSAVAALGATAPTPTVPAGFTITKIATPIPSQAANCDDVAFLEGHLYVACQNKAKTISAQMIIYLFFSVGL